MRARGRVGHTLRQESKGPWQARGLADPPALGSWECAQSSELKNQLRADTLLLQDTLLVPVVSPLRGLQATLLNSQLARAELTPSTPPHPAPTCTNQEGRQGALGSTLAVQPATSCCLQGS